MNIRRLILLRNRVRAIRDSKPAFSDEFFYWNGHNFRLSGYITKLLRQEF